MKKIYLSLICTLLFVGAKAQISYGFDYKENYQSFSNKDANSSVIIALYNSKQDSTLRAYSAILSVEDSTSDPSLNAKNGTHFSITPAQQKVEFAPGQMGFRNEKLIKINPVADNVFWGQRAFRLNLTVYEGFSAGNLAFGHQFITIIIDYNGTKIGVPRLDKSNFTIYPNPSSSNIFITGVNISNIEVLDLMGKVVLTQNSPSNELNIESLPAGMYIINALSDKGLVVQKIIKQ
jgi:hypothetical protein